MSWDRIGRATAHGAIRVVQLYRTMISPLRPATCRFVPTCSQYAVDALDEFGLLRGSWLAIVRLVKCGPWHRGGWDPIPDRCEGECEPRAHSGETGDSATLRSDSFV